MKELIKPNQLNEKFELVDTKCGELQTCPQLQCQCKNGVAQNASSIESEDDILF